MASHAQTHARPRRDALRRPLKMVALYAVLLPVTAVIVIPLVFGLLGGFKDNLQLTNDPLGLPSPWLTGNYTDMLGSVDFWRPLGVSILISFGAVAGTLALGALAAFVLARFSFPGREGVFVLFSTGLMFPFAVAVVPLFIILRTLGLLNNPLGVILPLIAFGLPLAIIILRNFFREIPLELEDAAKIDGCSPFGFFWRVLLPMARPAMAVVSVVSLVLAWNSFLLPLVVLLDQEWWTLPLAATQFQGRWTAETGRILAYVTLAIAPALVFYAFAERHLVSGLAAGAVKG